MPSHWDITTECGDGGGSLIEGTVGGIERSYRDFDVLLNKLVSIVKYTWNIMSYVKCIENI